MCVCVRAQVSKLRHTYIQKKKVGIITIIMRAIPDRCTNGRFAK